MSDFDGLKIGIKNVDVDSFGVNLHLTFPSIEMRNDFVLLLFAVIDDFQELHDGTFVGDVLEKIER